MTLEFSAPAKIILLGEHAVVYDQPAIAVALLNLRATATVESNPPLSTGLRIIAEDLDQIIELMQQGDDSLTFITTLILDRLGIQAPQVTIRLRSQIPMASGLGSGAAIATVLTRALCTAAQYPLNIQELNSIVYEIEKYHHGTPSGIDNTVVVYEQPVYFCRGNPIERLSIAQPFRIIVADTGQRALTKVAVGDVRHLFENDPGSIQDVIEQIGKVVRQARHHIEDGNINQLGELMNINHQLLKQLTVSSRELDDLVDAAIKAGALGAKLSGGGRGGNMIALVTDDTREVVKTALIRTGAARVFETHIGF